jgi:hypothetical protein
MPSAPHLTVSTQRPRRRVDVISYQGSDLFPPPKKYRFGTDYPEKCDPAKLRCAIRKSGPYRAVLYDLAAAANGVTTTTAGGN